MFEGSFRSTVQKLAKEDGLPASRAPIAQRQPPMIAIRQLVCFSFVITSSVYLFSQGPTNGRIAGTVRDVQGAVIPVAQVFVENPSTGERRSTASDTSGNYSLPFLAAGIYDVKIQANGFAAAFFRNVKIGVNETAVVNAQLHLSSVSSEITVSDAPPSLETNSSELSTTIDSRLANDLPLPTRNILQLLTLSPGVSAPITNNNAIGRNSPNVSVNGARITQNSYRINGIDANDVSMHVLSDVGVPAPESVSEVDVQTSMYDATVAGAGASVQVVGKSGSNSLHGSLYEYLRNEFFNANDANLRTAGDRRPEMRRNVYGATVGGPISRNNAFFFGSYQGTRDANGTTDQSIYKNVLIGPGLTDDRSDAALIGTFGVPSVDPISSKLLNFKLSNGRFLIPTPDANGLATGTALSTYHEEQFSTNVDYHPRASDSLSARFYLSDAPLFSALGGSNFGTPASLPGFGNAIEVDDRVLSVVEAHSFSPSTLHELHFGYSLIRHAETPQESLRDDSIGISRQTAAEYPGLPLILMGRDEGGAVIGTSDITYRATGTVVSVADSLSLLRGKHALRLGGELRHFDWRVHAAVWSYGEIDFPTFQDFLLGNTGESQFGGSTGFAHLGTGFQDRDLLTTDYDFFVQDEWRILPRLTLNLGLRYELDPPPYDSLGRIGGFDPQLYLPPTSVDQSGAPIGPPTRGIVEPGNAPAQYHLPGTTIVGKRVLKSIDPNNLAPRIGFAWTPFGAKRLAVRGGYGIFYSQPSFFYVALQYFNPPFFLEALTSGQPFSNPFGTAPPQSSFPLITPGPISGWNVDRNARTPYTQQFNTSLQYEYPRNTTIQIAYVGTRGLKLYRTVNINQAPIASIDHPITNPVTGLVITDNTPDNAALRAPLQGVSSSGFGLNGANGYSTYHSLQASINRRLSRGLQFTAFYAFSKSIDDAPKPGWGPGANFDTASLIGNQLLDIANRGLSDFDITHRFVAGYVWDLPNSGESRMRWLFSNWQLSGIVSAMSGTPVDIVDITGGSLYGMLGARPNWAAGKERRAAITNVPPGFYFNPSAFSAAMVPPGSVILGAHDPRAYSSTGGTEFGNIGRNIIRGPAQNDIDFSISKHFSITEAKDLRFQADFFNLLNHPNRDAPNNDINDPDFGKAIRFSSSPRILQLSLKLTF
jgi:carboxypeptidase family protein